jgi:monofunctional biosynthetic peptidoglycan transglycosylase
MLNFHNPSHTAWMNMRLKQAKARHRKLVIRHDWVPLNSISKNLQLAVIKAEDDRFYQHWGFDIEAMRKAYNRNERSNRIKFGGSTITQQLAKNLYLSPQRSYWRKFREAWITLNMELFLSKRRILELYLNSIEWGPGIFGVEAGAKHYFNVNAKNLNLEQSCRLAAIIPSPLRYKIYGDYVNRRTQILMLIVSRGETFLIK